MDFIRKAYIKIKLFFRLVLTAAVIFSAAYGTYLFSEAYRTTRVFDLKKIVVHNNRLLTPGDVIELSEILRGVRIGNIDTEKVEKKINSSPYVRSSTVKRKYPATIEITVTENVPLAYYNSAGSLRYVDFEGKVLGKAKPGDGYDLPVFISVPDEETVDFMCKCAGISPFTYHHISELEMTDSGVELYLIKSSARVIIGKNEFEKKIIVLENFLKNEYGNLAFNRIEYIDLRFDKQVVLKEISIAEK